MHFGERHTQLLPFCEYVFASGKSPVELHTEIPDIFLLSKVYIVYVDWWTGFSSCGECDLDRLGFHFFNHFLNASKLVCSFSEAMPGSLSAANTAKYFMIMKIVITIQL
jgi:hypothetical protein